MTTIDKANLRTELARAGFDRQLEHALAALLEAHPDATPRQAVAWCRTPTARRLRSKEPKRAGDPVAMRRARIARAVGQPGGAAA